MASGDLSMETLTTQEALNDLVERSNSEPVILYKHSVVCPVSARAQEQVVELKHDIPTYAVVVQYARDISEQVAETFDIKHETPQVIIVKEGKPVADFSHANITTKAVRDAVEQAS